MNSYAKVEYIFAFDSVNEDTLQVGQITGFHPGDFVLVIQMKGAFIDDNQDISEINAAGKYEVTIIKEIDTLQKYFILNSPLLHVYDVNELVQVIKIPKHEQIKITGTIKAQDWNGHTGGIVALIADKKLVLNAPIDVVGAGMRGAIPDTHIYAGECFTEAGGYDKYNYLLNAVDSAGKKGEGILSVTFSYLRGKGNAINGGGGGNGKAAGGYGGGNAGEGGRGGHNIETCTEIDENKPFGGKITDGYYTNSGSHRNRLFMGGGGGTGTQLQYNGATQGGNGGGIVFILSDTIVGNGYSILADGQKVEEIAYMGGAGGGGGGGTVVLDFDILLDTLSISVMGGRGGYSYGDICIGPGGGGGGGFLWVKNYSGLEKIHDINLLGGTSGFSDFCGTFGASSATEGAILTGLKPTLNGFLFNFIKNDQTICQNQIPEILLGSIPKGGDGNYEYLWQMNQNSTNWSTAITGSYNEKDFTFNQPLSDTTYLRRIVQTDISETRIISDTSKIITITVLPLIENKLLLDTMILCYGQSTDTIFGDFLTGGNGNYQYQWEYKTNQEFLFETKDTNRYLYKEALFDTTYFRRIVESGPCESVSDTFLIMVLPSIERNEIFGYEFACRNDTTPIISGFSVTGGDGNYLYKWESFDFLDGWDSVDSGKDKLHFQASILTDTTAYRRIVFSGKDHCCKDTSSMHMIHVIDPILYNIILPDSSIICSHTKPSFAISGTYPKGGAGEGSYQYKWLFSNDTTNGFIESKITKKDLQADTLIYKTLYKREVSSEACTDTSDIAVIDLYGVFEAKLFSYDTIICSGHQIPAYVEFSGSHGPWLYSFEIETTTKVFDDNITDGADTIIIKNTTAVEKIDTIRYTIAYAYDTNFCNVIRKNISGEILTVVHNYPEAFAGNDTLEVCETSGSLEAAPSYGQGVWRSLNDNIDFSDSTQFNTTYFINKMQRNTFQLVWKETNWNCTDTDTLSLIYYPSPVVDAGEDIYLYGSKDTALQASPLEFDEKGSWRFIENIAHIENPDNPLSPITNLQFGTKYILEWSVEKGVCPLLSDTLAVFAEEFFVPSAFSPNQDGINDYFEILGLENAERKELTIFNRWGKQIYYSNDYQNDWDGTIHGSSIAEGVYYYILNLYNERGTTDFKGYFIMKR